MGKSKRRFLLGKNLQPVCVLGRGLLYAKRAIWGSLALPKKFDFVDFCGHLLLILTLGSVAVVTVGYCFESVMIKTI